MSNRRPAGSKRPGPAPPPPAQRNQAKLVAAVVVPLVVAGALLFLLPGSDENGDNPVVESTTTTTKPVSPEAKAYQTRVDDALRTFAQALPPVIKAAGEWVEGKGAAETLTGELNRFLPQAVAARRAVAALPVLEEAPSVRDIYRDAVGLYAEFARVYLVAVEPAAADLKAQLDLIARRLRVLADRTYDQARTLVDPESQSLGGDSVEIRRAPEVPDWEAEGLAAGPPLADFPPPPPPEVPPQREGPREEQPEKEWLEEVRRANFPSGADLAEAIDSGDEPRLNVMTESITAYVTALRFAPDPEGGRVRSAVVALSYLVQGEAIRTAQAATVLPAGPARDRLTRVAKRVALAGESLLEPDLRGHPSRLDPRLLEDEGP
ncbi:MAG: hypothetical protein ACRDZ7_21275 [Acidimicrobiia bacterium]